MYKPTSAVIAVTYRCNSRCMMCNIWRREDLTQLEPEVYNNLPENLDEVNITGGEPFLRDDLVRVLEVINNRCHPNKIVIPTNGFLTERVLKIAKDILAQPFGPKTTIAISLDGIGAKHDEIRGIPGGFEKVLATIKGLQEIGFPKNHIGFGYTFVTGNEDEYHRVYELSKELGVNFGVSIAHNSENYFGSKDNQVNAKKVEAELTPTIHEKITSFSKNELGKCYYLSGMIYYAQTHQRYVRCDALTGSFFVDPFGEVYPCNILMDSIGNITKNTFDEIWNSERAKKVRIKTANCPTPCWMVCTSKSSIKKHWMKTGWWILVEKIKRILG